MKIIEKQKKEEQNLRQKVVKVIKKEEKLVRNTVEKYKQMVVFGLKEEKVVNRMAREEKEGNTLSKILKKVTSEDKRVMQQVEEFHRIGKYEDDKVRPIRIKFATQV